MAVPATLKFFYDILIEFLTFLFNRSMCFKMIIFKRIFCFIWYSFCIFLGSYFKMSTAENVLLIFYWLEWIDGVKFMRVDIFSLFKHAWTGLMSVYSTIDFETILQSSDTRNDLRFKTKSSKLQIVKVAQSFEIWVKFYKSV